MPDNIREIRHFHLACGLGGGAKGFNMASPRAGGLVGKMRCIGGVDVDPAAIRDFERATGTKGTLLDLFSHEQYVAFHGHQPPAGWREATPGDLRTAAGNERPHISFASFPCKGNSGLLSEKLSKTGKYQALNELALRATWLMLEAWADDSPELILFENVPRIVQRSRALLDQIGALLTTYGYAVAETTHDCGRLGGLAQSRKRFLMVARHIEKVPPFLYEPVKRPLRAVGDVLGRMPLPGDPAGGAMHRIPRLQWKTWVRLAFVQAGADWRSLQQLEVVDGLLRDFAIVPDVGHEGSGVLGVRRWTEPCGTVASRSGPTNGAFSVADPRFEQSRRWHDGQAYGVRRWSDSTGAITGQQNPGQDTYCIADPRFKSGETERQHDANRFRIICQNPEARGNSNGNVVAVTDPRPRRRGELFTKYPVTAWQHHTGTVIGGDDMGAYAVADPRLPHSDGRHYNQHRVSLWNEPTNCITGAQHVAGGATSVADPRVVGWEQNTGAVSASGGHDNGRWRAADPRCMPAAADKLVAVIRALDGTWHRPFTTLELAALQSLVDPEEHLELDGLSDQAWRERIGNAVPPHAAQAIAEVMGTTLLLAWAGETFMLSSQPIWVRPIAIALAVDLPS